MTDSRPHPPSIERVLAAWRARAGAKTFDPDELDARTSIARTIVADERDRLRSGIPAQGVDALAEAAQRALDQLSGDASTSALPPVINATGVVLHTNLGRAPWPQAAIEAAREAAEGYGLLELDLTTGHRGPRFRVAEDHLVALTGAEDALLVNNNAAAVALAVGLAGPGGGVVVSRGELVEIGGGVRIPEIVERAGARLIEIGTTNRTRADDYSPPLERGDAAVVLRVHPSNFTMAGFIEQPDLRAVADLAHRHGAIVIDDLGSGALIETERFGLVHEPTPGERLGSGADLVTFSGDKLVGGPQVGLIVGRRELIGRLRGDPLARAMRPDKAMLAGTAATLGLYRAGLAAGRIPVWQMISTPADLLRDRATAIAERAGLTSIEVVPLVSPVGGGSLPGQTIPSWGLAVRCTSLEDAAAALRAGEPRILARIADDRLVFDLRTVPRDRDGDLGRRILEVVAAQTERS